jgi:hypothetical protein
MALLMAISVAAQRNLIQTQTGTNLPTNEGWYGCFLSLFSCYFVALRKVAGQKFGGVRTVTSF